jgi:hypothetical protein
MHDHFIPQYLYLETESFPYDPPYSEQEQPETIWTYQAYGNDQED